MKISALIMPPPVKARHVKRTYVSSPEDEASQPTREIIEFALSVIRRTLDIDVSAVGRRIKGTPCWTDTWPGEHYRLLAGIVAHLAPSQVIEVGTLSGISALCLRQELPAKSSLTTFDLVPWNKISDTALVEDDFKDGRLKQVLGDLADEATFDKHRALLEAADFLFVDGPKDGKFEPAFAKRLDTVTFTNPPWVLFDDIRDLHMLQFWRDLRHPKLDLSSFGHWTGTGLVRWE